MLVGIKIDTSSGVERENGVDVWEVVDVLTLKMSGNERTEMFMGSSNPGSGIALFFSRERKSKKALALSVGPCKVESTPIGSRPFRQVRGCHG